MYSLANVWIKTSTFSIIRWLKYKEWRKLITSKITFFKVWVRWFIYVNSTSYLKIKVFFPWKVLNIFLKLTGLKKWDEVVLSKTVLSNFRPKQVNEWIGGPRGSIIELFIAILNWPDLTGSNRPLSLFFHPPTLPGYPLECWQFAEFWKIDIIWRGVQLLNFLLLS